MTPDKRQFQSQVLLSQINVILPIRLKFKLYAVFIEWVCRIDFLFMGRQYIVNYWHSPSKISGNCHKRLGPKFTRHDYWEMFVNICLHNRLFCFADFVGRNLLACLEYASSLPPMAPFLFLLPMPNCFLSVCLPTLFAAVLVFFLLITTSAISGTANSNKSAPTRLAAGTIYLRKIGIAFLPITCASAPIPRPCCRSTSLKNEISTSLEATIL